MTTMIDSLGIEIKSTGNIRSTINNLNKLSTSLENVKKSSGGFNNLNKMMGKTSSTANTLKKAFNFGAVVYTLRKITQGVATSVNEINEYIENMNLFNVSMGEFYEEAKEYAELLQNKMGIDSSEWMRNQGVFMSMATGFGLAKDQAYQLSKGMTELSYDMSSFYNIPIEEALTKMRSALAGEIEPLRALGISLTEASLKELALANGITKSVEAMTEGEKAQLRYVSIVQKATNQGVIGDFARTLESPANALRILQQQFTQLARAIGSVFLPIIAQVMPYVQAFVKVLTNLISRLATLLGFTMPKWDNKSWDSGATSVGATADALGTATKKAKEYKKHLQGFDEINIIPAPQEASGGSGSAGTGGDLGLNLKSIWEESMINDISTKTDEIIAKFKTLGETVKEVVMIFGSIAVGFLAWKGISALAMGMGSGFGIIKSALETVGIYALYAKDAIVGIFTGASSTFLPMVAVVGAVASVVYTLWKHFDTVVAVIKDFIQNIGLKEKFDEIKLALAPLLDAVGGLGTVMEFVGSVILLGLQPAIMVIMGVFNAFINVIKPIITIVTGIIQVFSGLGTFLVGVFTGNLDKVKQGVSMFGTGIWNILSGMVSTVTGLIGGFLNGIYQYFASVFEKVLGVPVRSFVSGVVNAVKNMWTSVVNWYQTNIAPKFTTTYWANKFVGFANGFKQSIKNMLNAGIDMINKFIGWLNSKLRFSWNGLSILGKQIYPSGSVQLVTIPQITQRFEDGGFIEDGLFTMNKGEIAGEFSNGKSVVANNQQIVAGISQGVYEAMMRANGNGKDITIYVNPTIDGKEVGKAVVKYHNGVVQQTGLSPLMI